ncbi:uncharacterized protein LOC144439400 [Glandiceps talaboti]
MMKALLMLVIFAAAVTNAYAESENVASGKSVTGIGTTIDLHKIVDGNPLSCGFVRKPTPNGPYFKIDLGKEYDVSRITVFLNPNKPRSFQSSNVRVGNDDLPRNNPICFSFNNNAKSPIENSGDCQLRGRYVFVWKERKSVQMGVCEVQVFGEVFEPTEAPTTAAPTTEAPTTEAPTTEAPTTAAPTTAAPTTAAPDVTTIPTTVACEFPSFIKPVTEGVTVSQSSTNAKVGGTADRAVDGNKDSNLRSGKSCTQTNKEFQPWWLMELSESRGIYKVVITNRQDCCSFRIKNAEVRVGDNPDWTKNPVCGNMVLGKRSKQETITVACGCDTPMNGKYVSIQLIDKTQMLHLCEVEVMA